MWAKVADFGGACRRAAKCSGNSGGGHRLSIKKYWFKFIDSRRFPTSLLPNLSAISHPCPMRRPSRPVPSPVLLPTLSQRSLPKAPNLFAASICRDQAGSTLTSLSISSFNHSRSRPNTRPVQGGMNHQNITVPLMRMSLAKLQSNPLDLASRIGSRCPDLPPVEARSTFHAATFPNKAPPTRKQRVHSELLLFQLLMFRTPFTF